MLYMLMVSLPVYQVTDAVHVNGEFIKLLMLYMLLVSLPVYQVTDAVHVIGEFACLSSY